VTGVSKKLIHVRFDVVKNMANRGADVFLARYDLPEVPLVGELVSVKGDPYHVIERGWSVGCQDGEEGRLFAYLRLR
jgi:hypothetical protein